MRIACIFPVGFKIRSLADVETFCKTVLQPGSYDIPDWKDKTLYHSIIKEGSGRVLLGSAHYGPNPLLAEIPCCDDSDIIRRIYGIRGSINHHFFEEDM